MKPSFTLGEIAVVAGAHLLRGEPAMRVEGVFTDSRKPEAGALFVALSGDRHDGSNFAVQAARDGAAALLVQEARAQRIAAEVPQVAVLAPRDTTRALGLLAQAFRGRNRGLRVCAITGSTGKTSTKELVAAVLARGGPTLKTEGNLNNEIGVPLTLLRLLPEHRFAAIECGMNHLGEIARLAGYIDAEVGIVTNVGPVHLEGVGSIEGVAFAKGELFHGLRRDGVAVASADDPRVLAQARLSGRRLLTFGAAAGSDVRLVAARHGDEGLEIALEIEGRARKVSLQLLGAHNGANAAAAAAAGLAVGISADDVLRGLAEARTPGRRMRPVPLSGGGLLIDDCYNANPISTQAALRALADLARGRGRALAVLGDMLELGVGELELHREVGRVAAGADLAFLLCFGTRARTIAEGAIAAGLPPTSVACTEDPAEAARLVEERRAPGDRILVKGSRGMRMERISDALAGDAPAARGG